MEDTVNDLLNKDLSGFKIIVATEVYRTNEDGMYATTIGYYKDETIAEAIAGQQTAANYTKTQKVIVLTGGENSFVLKEPNAIFFVDENEELLNVKNTALSKLSGAEKKLLEHT